MRLISKSARLACFFVLLLLCLAGCTKETAQEESVTSLTALQYELENQTIDFSDMWFYDQLEEKTNVHVDFEEVKDADWVTRTSLMFASNSYKDMILRGYLDTEEYGVSQGLIVPLDAYIEEYMPTCPWTVQAMPSPPPTAGATMSAICSPRTSIPTDISSSTAPGWTGWGWPCPPPLRN